MATDASTSLPTVSDLAQVAEDELRTALDPEGTGKVDLHDGSRLTALVSLQAALWVRVAGYVADRVAAARARTATADDLDIVGSDDYGLPRKVAAPATGQITLTRLVALTGPSSIPQGSRFAVPASATGPAVIYLARVPVPLLEFDTTCVVPLVAQDAGTAGNIADPTTVTQIVDTLPVSGWTIGVPPVGTVFGGGDDDETDDVYRARLLQSGTPDTREKGTKRAILTGALAVPGARYATAVEPGNGTVVLYVGDPAYNLTPLLRTTIIQSSVTWRCFGVAADVRAFTPAVISIRAEIHMETDPSNYDAAAIVAAASAAVVAYFDGREHPDEFWPGMVQSAISNAFPGIQYVYLQDPVIAATRPVDSGYAGLATIYRYRADPGAMRFTILGPTTT